MQNFVSGLVLEYTSPQILAVNKNLDFFKSHIYSVTFALGILKWVVIKALILKSICAHILIFL